MPTNLRLTGKMERTVDAQVTFREAQQEGEDGEWGFVIVGAVGQMTYREHTADINLGWNNHLQIHPDDGPIEYEWYHDGDVTVEQIQASGGNPYRGSFEEREAHANKPNFQMGYPENGYFVLPEWAREFIGGELTINGVKSGVIRTGYVSRESEQPDGSWVTRYQESIVMDLTSDHTDAIFESLPGLGAREWRKIEDDTRRNDYLDWVRNDREGEPPFVVNKD